MKFNSNWAKKSYWEMIDDEKIFFVDGNKIGVEYIFIRKLIVEGMGSSSGLRKIIEKIKEKED